MAKWTNRQITKVKKLWNEGMKLSDIAKKMNRSTAAVGMKINALQKKGELDYRHKDKTRVKIPSRKLTQGQKNVIRSAYNDYVDYRYKSDLPDDKVVKYMTKKQTTTQDKIEKECNTIRDFLLAKNEAYGDSAIAPIRIFSKSDVQEQIKVRIDDKLNRLMQGKNTLETDEDVVKDLIGYLVLLLIQMKE